jgi:hypothetical protein
MSRISGSHGGMSMNMAVFWVVVPCSLVKFTDVSEVFAASIIAMNLKLKIAIFCLFHNQGKEP